MAVGEKMKRKKTTAAELPEEVVRREILTRVPIKAAVRFKCVSKTWLSLFSDPHFAKEHLSRNSAQNPNDYDCLIAKRNTKIVILARYKETLALLSENFRVVGSVRGLVCLNNDDKLSLWNPAIHQSKKFFIPPRRSSDQKYDMGFGFDPVSDNYKVVVLSNDLRSASVYYSNSDDWIDVSLPDYAFLEKRGKPSSSITIVKDCPYWTFRRYTQDKHLTAIYLTAVKFDAGSNEFKLLPEFNFDIKGCGESCACAFTFEFVDMNDCLTLVLYDRSSSKCMLDIFSLDGVEGCCVWSKMHSIGPLKFPRPYWSVVSQGFCGGEIVFHDHLMFCCYDRKTDTIKRLSMPSTAAPIVTCFRYTPSLAFLEGMKSVYLTTQTGRASGLCCRVPRRLINSLNF